MPETSCDVVIVDDDPSVLRALDKQVRAMGYSTRTFDDPVRALEALERDEWKCLLVDLSMPEMDGIELQSRLEARADPFSIVFLSGVASVRSVAKAMRHGAIDFLEKPVERDDLKAALHEAVQDVESARQAREASAAAQARFDQLTERQKQVFWQLSLGANNKEIARKLEVSERTIKAHRSAIRARLGLVSQTEMMEFANALPAARADNGAGLQGR